MLSGPNASSISWMACHVVNITPIGSVLCSGGSSKLILGVGRYLHHIFHTPVSWRSELVFSGIVDIQLLGLLIRSSRHPR